MTGVLEIFVRGFEEAEIEAVHRNLWQQVAAKQDAICKAQEEFSRRIGLATEFRRARTDVDQDIRVGFKH